MKDLPGALDYPIVAVGDLHGQIDELQRLVAKLERLPEWPDCALAFLGDFVDRNPGVRATIDLAMELLDRPAGGSAVMGNHDLALVRAARLDGGPASPYWSDRYRLGYDCRETFQSYLGRASTSWGDGWGAELEALREAMPRRHRDFLASLRWVVEAPGHLFLHNGLSDELQATPEAQVEALHARRWERSTLSPLAGTDTDRYWVDEYPVWLGADRGLSASPLPYPGKVQVTGHDRVRRPEADAVRVRIDTGGGRGELTACLLKSADAAPVFISSR